MKYKQAISKTLHSLAYRTGASVGRAKFAAVGRILKFHGVGDGDYSKTDFESHLKFLADHFSIVRIESFIGKIANGESPKNEIVLTFDDGLRNNFASAYPILQRLGLPATFFICPGLVEKSLWLWTHEVRARLKFLGSKRDEFFSRWKALTKPDTEQFVAWMKRIRIKERANVETELRGFSSEFFPTPEQRKKYDLMNWDELRSIDPALITIGSHTMTHPILPSLNHDELVYEISASRKLLEEKLNRAVEFFCYPNGGHNQSVIEETRKHYRAAVSTEVGFVTPASNLHRLPRIGIAQNFLCWPGVCIGQPHDRHAG